MHIGGKNGIQGDDGIASCDCCEPACEYPLLDVTLTWTDADVTKTFLGETFTNGETRAICPTTYSCTDYTGGTGGYPSLSGTITLQEEAWSISGTSNASPSYQRTTNYKRTTYGNPPTYSTVTNSGQFSGIRLSNNYRVLFSYPLGPFPSFNTVGFGNRLRVRRGGTDAVQSIHSYDNVVTTYSGTAPFRYTRETVSASANNGGNTPTRTTFNNGIDAGFEGSITSSGGLTIAWARNNTGEPWGDCFT